MNAAARIVKRLRSASDLSAELDKLEAEIRSKVKREIRKAASVKAPGRSREDRRATKTESNRAEYEKVRERDGGLCQVQLVHVMGKCEGALHIDHQWGRGKEPTLVTNCRSLCLRHDRMKTDNETEQGASRLLWLCDYREWAVLHGYFDEIEKTEGQIALERAQHPEARREAPF